MLSCLKEFTGWVACVSLIAASVAVVSHLDDCALQPVTQRADDWKAAWQRMASPKGSPTPIEPEGR